MRRQTAAVAHHALAVRYGVDFGVCSHGYLALELWQLGYPDQALQHSQEARTLAPAAHGQAEAAITLATAQGFAQWLTRGTVLRGWALARQGQGEAGMAEMHQGLAADLATGSTLWQPYYLVLLAEAYGAGGRAAEGLAVLAEALAMMDTTEARIYEAELSRLKGALLLHQAVPDAAQAEACFQQAQGKHQDAHDLLAPVYEWFTEGLDTADLQEARALLDELS
jgi:predicted ATPase